MVTANGHQQRPLTPAVKGYLQLKTKCGAGVAPAGTIGAVVGTFAFSWANCALDMEALSNFESLNGERTVPSGEELFYIPDAFSILN